jgi:hypothetical protein
VVCVTAPLRELPLDVWFAEELAQAFKRGREYEYHVHDGEGDPLESSKLTDAHQDAIELACDRLEKLILLPVVVPRTRVSRSGEHPWRFNLRQVLRPFSARTFHRDWRSRAFASAHGMPLRQRANRCGR